MNAAPATARWTIPLVAVAALVVALLAGAAPGADAQIAWAPADEATIHPGVQMYTDGAQCTANFVFTDGTDVFIGYAAHCAGTGGSTETNGCEAGTLPTGTPVEIEGATQPGTLTYSSWQTMQQVGETESATCEYNDFALVRIDPADHGRVNPSIPFWGGPTGLDTDGTTSGEPVYSYGNSSLRGGVQALSPKEGTSLGTCCGGWSHQVYTATPGIPGDSGSAFVDGDGAAFGVLSTVAIAPFAGSNGVGDLGHELDYMRANSSFGAVDLVLGTEPFDADARLSTLGLS